MVQNELVSVIVPIYKVEQYIRRCIDSIRKQTYPHLEIILVNDGSPDECGKIADEYERLDDRIQVIHKENGGLSDARNEGMKRVTGTYTMFVDSDDWLAETMVETMMNYRLEYKADVVQSAFYYAYDDRLLIERQQADEQPICLTNEEVMQQLVKNDLVKNFAWGKLYKTTFIKDIPFIKGVLFEDVFWAHHVMHHVDTYLIIHDPFYFYCQRDDSIVTSYSPRNLDMIKGLKERHRFIETFYTELINDSYEQILKACLIHYNLLVMNKKKDKLGFHRIKLKSYVEEHYHVLKNAVKDNQQLRRQLYLFSIHPYLNLIFLSFRKGLRKLNILSSPVGLKQVSR